MSRQSRTFWAIVLSAITPLSGCAPSKTFYFLEDGDLSHYKGMAKTIEYPDVENCTLADVSQSHAPPTLRNYEEYQIWELSLEEAVTTTLTNSKIVRLLQGGVPGSLLNSPDGSPSIYDPALQAANPGSGGVGAGRPGQGVESALSAFDAQLTTSMFWQRNERPQNIAPGNDFLTNIFPLDFLQDQATFQAELAKTAATGTRFSVQQNTIYDLNNQLRREVPSDYNVNFQVEARQPFLQGNGTMFNRIAGPNATVGNYNGVMIARINGDITLADFENQVMTQVRQVEDTYWDLYSAYRTFDAAKRGSEAVFEDWKKVKTQYDVGSAGGASFDEARARSEYFAFRAAVEDAWRNLHGIENRLRFLMGIAASDCRLIRPLNEPTTAKVQFDWCEINQEALMRHVNLRRQKWNIKKSELELIAARNFLLPRLDGVARYRWLGLGDDLIQADGRGLPPTAQDNGDGSFSRIKGTNAFSTLTSGDFQEWELGFQASMPLGFRRELAGVRFAQLKLARDRALLQDQELSVSHLLTDAVRNLDCNYALAETNYNRLIAAQKEVAGIQARKEGGTQLESGGNPLDLLLNARRREAEAEREYYRQLVEYQQAITEIHFHKGSLLEYNNVCLSEGPWSAKAYYDARQRARERDAGLYLNYGYTRPAVISRGPYDQHSGQAFQGHPTPGVPTPAGPPPEEVPAPMTNGEEPQPNGVPRPPMRPDPSTRQPRSIQPEGPRLSSAEGY